YCLISVSPRSVTCSKDELNVSSKSLVAKSLPKQALRRDAMYSSQQPDAILNRAASLRGSFNSSTTPGSIFTCIPKIMDVTGFMRQCVDHAFPIFRAFWVIRIRKRSHMESVQNHH